MVAAGPGPAVMAEVSPSGDSVPRAERHLGDPQPGRVLCSLSQAQLGHGSLEGGRMRPRDAHKQDLRATAVWHHVLG